MDSCDMRKPDLAAQVKTVVSSFVMASVGAALVVCVGLMARPNWSDIPQGVASAGVSAGVVKASTSSTWAARDGVGIR